MKDRLLFLDKLVKISNCTQPHKILKYYTGLKKCYSISIHDAELASNKIKKKTVVTDVRLHGHLLMDINNNTSSSQPIQVCLFVSLLLTQFGK